MASSTTQCLGRGLVGRPQPIRSGFMGSRVLSSAPRAQVKRTRQTTIVNSGKEFDKDWINSNPIVVALGLVGWIVPSSINVPAYGGSSLTASFINSIFQEWTHFPTGPSIDSDFWLYLVTWHIGLFLCLTLGQIGWVGRKQGYFP